MLRGDLKVLAVPFIVFLFMLWPLRGGFTDDGYIHIRYADNILTLGEYSFNPGDVSYGTTSPLWVLMHAAAGKFTGGGESLIVVSTVLAWLSGFASVWLIFVLARRLGLSIGFGIAAALSLAGHAWFARWTALAMETSTAVAAILAAGYFSIRADQDRRQAMFFGFFMALAALLRPEAYLLVPVFLLSAILRRERNWTAVATSIAIYFAMIVPWLLFARLHIRTFLPNTAGAKSGGVVLNPIMFVRKLEPVVKIVASGEGIALILVILGIVLLRRRSRLFSPMFRFILLWIVALPFTYVLFDIQVLSRYMLLTSPFVIVLGFAALEEIVDGKRIGGALSRIAPLALAAISVVINAVFYMVVVVPPSRAFTYDLKNTLKGIGRYVHDHSNEGAVVAAADIGYLAFYSDRTVLDLGGLVDRTTHALREKYDYETIVKQGLYLTLDKYPRVDFMIDREKEKNRFDGRVMNGYRFESVRVERIENLGIRKPGPYYYTLYKLHVDG